MGKNRESTQYVDGVRKWDVHIHCDQHFQFSVFEILVLFSFDLVFGPVE